MTIADRKDFGEVMKARHAEQQRQLIPMIRLLAGAAPVMDKLVRSEEWTRYCTYLQGVLERHAAAKKVAQDKLGDPAVVNDEEVRKLRQDIFVADVTTNTLKFAIELPAAILAGGEEAQKFVDQFEKKNEPTGNA